MFTSFQDIYNDANAFGGAPTIQPICLPPYGPVKYEHINPDTAGSARKPSWYRDGAPLIPFEDLDCEPPGTDDVTGSWMQCHAMRLEDDPHGLFNIQSGNSFMTGFRRSNREDDEERPCRTNAYGPSVYQKCNAECETGEDMKAPPIKDDQNGEMNKLCKEFYQNKVNLFS